MNSGCNIFNESLKAVEAGTHLNRIQAAATLVEIMDLDIALEDVEKFLLGLKSKGESIDEVSGFVDTLKNRSIKVCSDRADLIDVCGTGGDGLNTFNVSTTVALMLAAAGLGVAKHGNRSVSSRSGSFDLIEALGLKFHATPEKAIEGLERFNIAFLFAPDFHPAFAKLGALRKKMGVRTVLNLLGPLINPVIGLKRQVMGIYRGDFLQNIAGVLQSQNQVHSMVVHGSNGVDELSIEGPSKVAHLQNGKISQIEIHPANFGLKTAPIEAIRGGSAEDNAQILMRIFDGEKGAPRDVVVLNGAAAFIVAGLARDFQDGIALGEATLDSGRARAHLKKMRDSR